MSNTFAKHVLGRAAAGLQATLAKQESEQKAAKTASTQESRRSAAPAATYASVVLVMAMGAGAASAATDGSLARSGGASTGKVGISLTIPERIDASGLSQVVQQTAFSASGAFVGETAGCIFGRGAKNYNLSVLADQSYTLSYAANGDAPQVLSSNDSFAGAGAMGCADGESNARLQITRAQQQAPATYAKALTLMVSPE